VHPAAEAQTAVDLATRLTGDAAKVVNAIAIEGRDQVALKVTVVEMARSALKQLGVQWNSSYAVGKANVGIGVNGAFSASGNAPQSVYDMINPTSDNASIKQIVGGSGIGILAETAAGRTFNNIKALEERRLLRTLAEPTLTAISGESAKFLAGGEFPVPVGTDNQGRVTIVFKTYGVGLDFTPVVLSQGRISLKVATEVSELTSDGAVSIAGASIPGLTVRRANTSVELPSGGSIVLAGLLQNNVRQSLSGLPGLLNLPVLGTLFRSRDYQSGQTELVVMVTPYIVKPVARKQLARPDDNFQPASDTDAILLGRLNKLYGAGAKPVADERRAQHGTYGHVID
jgi:pilus assembly protein CpaC